jgi:hypothetical protein
MCRKTHFPLSLMVATMATSLHQSISTSDRFNGLLFNRRFVLTQVLVAENSRIWPATGSWSIHLAADDCSVHWKALQLRWWRVHIYKREVSGKPTSVHSWKTSGGIYELVEKKVPRPSSMYHMLTEANKFWHMNIYRYNSKQKVASLSNLIGWFIRRSTLII